MASYAKCAQRVLNAHVNAFLNRLHFFLCQHRHLYYYYKSHLSGISFERRLAGFLQCHSQRRNRMVVRATLRSCIHSL